MPVENISEDVKVTGERSTKELKNPKNLQCYGMQMLGRKIRF